MLAGVKVPLPNVKNVNIKKVTVSLMAIPNSTHILSEHRLFQMYFSFHLTHAPLFLEQCQEAASELFSPLNPLGSIY